MKRTSIVFLVLNTTALAYCFYYTEWWPRWADILGAGLAGIGIGFSLHDFITIMERRAHAP